MANVTVIPARRRRMQTNEEQIIPKIKVAAYCRVSTDSDEQATSYEMQVEHYTEYITKNPEWELVDIYADDGISGTNTKKREEFNRMIEDCMAGKIDMIITKSISRFARNTLDCLQYIRKLKDKNISVFFEKENINTMDTKVELLITIMASLAQQESQSLSQNVKMGIQFRYQAGKVQVNHNRFLGYTKDEDGNLIIEPEEAETIKRINREYLEGASLKDICDSLMADGILTGARKKNWIPSTVHKILTNEKYIGDALLQKTVTTDFLEKKRQINNGLAQYYVEGSHEPIIPKHIFMRVQEELVRRANLRSGKDGRKKRVYSSKYALSSICTCEKCRDVYRRIAWNNRGKKSTVWRCCTRVEHGPGVCDAPTIPEEDLQAAVMKAINDVHGRKSEVIKQMEIILEQMVSIDYDERLADIDARMEELQLKLVDLNTTRLESEDLSRDVNALREEKERIMVAIAEDKGRQLKKEEMIRFLQEQTAELDEFDDALVRKLVEQVVVHGDGTFTVEFKSGELVEL